MDLTATHGLQRLAANYQERVSQQLAKAVSQQLVETPTAQGIPPPDAQAPKKSHNPAPTAQNGASFIKLTALNNHDNDNDLNRLVPLRDYPLSPSPESTIQSIPNEIFMSTLSTDQDDSTTPLTSTPITRAQGPSSPRQLYRAPVYDNTFHKIVERYFGEGEGKPATKSVSLGFVIYGGCKKFMFALRDYNPLKDESQGGLKIFIPQWDVLFETMTQDFLEQCEKATIAKLKFNAEIDLKGCPQLLVNHFNEDTLKFDEINIRLMEGPWANAHITPTHFSMTFEEWTELLYNHAQPMIDENCSLAQTIEDWDEDIPSFPYDLDFFHGFRK